MRICLLLAIVTLTNLAFADDASPIRVGIIGLDTSHAPAFAKEMNNPEAKDDVVGCKVVSPAMVVRAGQATGAEPQTTNCKQFIATNGDQPAESAQ